VVMLNPSTADAQKNDPTVARVCSFLRAQGVRRFVVTNLFAFVTPYPEDLAKAHHEGIDVVGPENDATIAKLAAGARLVLVAWGTCSAAPRLARERVREVCLAEGGALVKSDLMALARTKQGAPAHPLYLPASLTPAPYDLAELLRWVRSSAR
jgi:hypothetical protein